MRAKEKKIGSRGRGGEALFFVGGDLSLSSFVFSFCSPRSSALFLFLLQQGRGHLLRLLHMFFSGDLRVAR